MSWKHHKPRHTLSVALSVTLGLALLTSCSVQGRLGPIDRDRAPVATPFPSQPSSLPPTSPSTTAGNTSDADEAAKAAVFAAYELELLLWLGSEGMNVSAYPDPMIGEWDVFFSSEALTFHDGIMMWYLDSDDRTDNYYRASYRTYPGAKTNAGYLYEADGELHYSVFLDYEYTMESGQGKETVFSGMFTVELQPDGSIRVFNQRTQNSWLAYPA